jgi:acyl transferase domain-containing protein
MEPVIATLAARPPSIRVLSTVDLSYYEPGEDCIARVRTNLVEQLVTQVDFIGAVERLYADGHRIFVEPGPKHALTGFVDDILGDQRPHQALFLNHPKFGEVHWVHRFLAQAAIVGAGPDAYDLT